VYIRQKHFLDQRRVGEVCYCGVTREKLQRSAYQISPLGHLLSQWCGKFWALGVWFGPVF
jgi:hypothetical protein